MPIKSEENGIITISRQTQTIELTRTVESAKRFAVMARSRRVPPGHAAAFYFPTLAEYFPTLADAIAFIKPRWVAGEFDSVWIEDETIDDDTGECREVFTEADFSRKTKAERRRMAEKNENARIDELVKTIVANPKRTEARKVVREWLAGPGREILANKGK